MCGICFTLKQRIHRRPRIAKDVPPEVVTRALMHQYSTCLHADTPQLHHQSEDAAGALQSDVDARMPHIEGYWLSPCACGACRRTKSGVNTDVPGNTPAAAANIALTNSLRIIRIFHNRYNSHPLDIATDTCRFASICANSPSYAAMLHNICRRGPDAFGATRRAFAEALFEVAASPSPALTPAPAPLRSSGTLQKGQKPTTGARASAEATVVAALNAASTSGAAADRSEMEWCSFSTDTQAISAVLGLRGHETVRQPYEIEVETDVEDKNEPNKSYLLWNGEIFNGPMCPPPWGSDTAALASRLSQLERSCVPGRRTAINEAARRHALPACQQRFLAKCVRFFESEIQGPYGFLFYASQLQMVVFGRDPLGRHSLLTHLSVHPVFTPLSAQNVRPQQQSPHSRGPAGSGVEAPPTTECTQLEVEFLLSSVASQHAPLIKETNDPAVSPPAPLTSEEDAAAPGGREHGHGAAGKRPSVKRRRDKDEDDEDDGKHDEDLSGQCGGDGPDALQCWCELPITGFFGLPLNIPLLQLPGSTAAVAGTQTPPTTGANGFFDSLPESLRAVLLHCPFEGQLHTTHPLLRAAVRAEKANERKDMGKEDETHAQLHSAPALVRERGPPVLRTPTMPEPPAAVVPALVQDAVHRAAPRDDSTEEAWVHWSACRYLEALSAAVYRRCNTASTGAEDARGVEKLYRARRRPLCIPFSGGIDCTVLAALAHCAMPIETPIELVSVAFGEQPDQAPDRIAALHAMRELLALPQPRPELHVYAPTGPPEPIGPEREWRLVLVDVPHKTTASTAHILDLMNPRHTVMDLDIATALWHAARARGRMQRLFASDVRSTAGSPGMRHGANAPTSLETFSKHLRIRPVLPASSSSTADPTAVGPEDSQADGNGPALCGAAEEPFKPLIEVLIAEGRSSPKGGRAPVLLSTLGKEYHAFLQPTVQQYGYKKLGNYLNDAVKAGVVVFVSDAPSKAVRLKRLEDLRRAVPPPPCPWFMTDAMRAAQASRRGDLDRSASGATSQAGEQEEEEAVPGTPLTPPEGTYEMDYCSTAKVLLLGMGADETLGGYTRYRRFFQRQGMDGARRELQLDFSRLWQRNLGRDDRVTMDSGREPRFPYLDEELLATLEEIVAARRDSLLEAPTSAVLTASAEACTALQDHILQLSIDPVLSFRLPPGEGDKRILRRAAAVIGLSAVTRLQKRAIQFGTRIADRKIRGSAEL